MLDAEASHEVPWLAELIKRIGEPAIRIALDIGMNLFSHHFVLGESLEDADRRIGSGRLQYTYSYDMLGEAAITMEDSERFFHAYEEAIRHLGEAEAGAVSLKLSAMHPRYDVLQRDRVERELYPRLRRLVMLARERNVSITIDAEEIDRQEICLDIVEKIIMDGVSDGWDKFGVAVQSYAVRSMSVLKYLLALARIHGSRLGVRLVKGAYWDGEIKLAQLLGLKAYPVFTRKAYTDVAFLACAHYLLQHRDQFYPQFATHNVQSVANILHWVKHDQDPVSFEFQRLHGMGQLLYDCILQQFPETNCCIYAPIGRPKELLPYLIRRLLENTANSSFVNQMASNVPVEQLVRHPTDLALNPAEEIPLPGELYQPERSNSQGMNLRNRRQAQLLLDGISSHLDRQWTAAPFIKALAYARTGSGPDTGSVTREVRRPDDLAKVVGWVIDTPPDQVADAVAAAYAALPRWRSRPAPERCGYILQLAHLLEANREELVALNGLEAGKTLQDSIAEIREAVDFCRYYAAEMSRLKSAVKLPGPTGEQNALYFRGRGPVVCISPWNFPIAIYIGQISAALVTGNVVIIKPAEQTSLIAARLFELIRETGLPDNVAQFVPGVGEVLGPELMANEWVAAVVFTGSSGTAQIINRQLAARRGALTPLVAETGGQNVMIADSSTLPEQLVKDVLQSAFTSAGQRCSSLRVLYVQDSSADTVMELLAGGIKELSVGNPLNPATDVGPVIDRDAQTALAAHIAVLDRDARLIARADRHHTCDLSQGFFILPCAYEIDSITQLKEEHFGPILHVIRYRTEDLARLISEINGTGFALTLGIHSRNEQFIERIEQQVNAGNIYINRNIIGAVVGTQPFGGFGLSGTGPKAGGPHYLQRFMVEICRTENTAAAGGDFQLLTR